MPLDIQLLEMLVDPEDHEPLYYFFAEDVLYNPRKKRRYEVSGGTIPVLLVDDATTVDDSEHERLMAIVGNGNAIATGSGPKS